MMFKIFIFVALLTLTVTATQNIVVDVPDMPKKDIQKVMAWIKKRTTSAKLPFCWRSTHKRGKPQVPGRVADCPRGYTNNGATCGRGSRDTRHPSKVASCPSGYRNMGLTCYRGPHTYSKGCTTIFKKFRCRPGYTDMGCTCLRPASSLGHSRFVCPTGYFKSSTTKRCHKTCPKGWTNTGEFCHLPVSTLGMGSMTCSRGERKIGARCYGPGGTLQSCLPSQGVNDAGLCYPRCRKGYTGVGPVCWQNCYGGWHNCALGCAKSAGDCALVVANQVYAPLVVAANVATMGLSSGATKAGAQTLKIGNKVFSSSTNVGKALITTVNLLQSVKPGSIKKGATITQRIVASRTDKVYKRVILQTKVEYKVHKAINNFADTYSRDFAKQTSPEIDSAINAHFSPGTAKFLKRTWAMQQLAEMAEVNKWFIAESVLSAVALADITGVTDVVAAYAKPVCQDNRPIPCIPASTKYRNGVC